MRVRWTEGGRTVDQIRTLGFHGGDRIRVDLPGPAATATRTYDYGAYYDDSGAPGTAPVGGFAPALPPLYYTPPPARSRFYDPDESGPRPGGPPGSNNPLSLGVGLG